MECQSKVNMGQRRLVAETTLFRDKLESVREPVKVALNGKTSTRLKDALSSSQLINMKR